MFVESRRTPLRSRAFEIRRREPRYVSSVPVMLQRYLRFGPVCTRGVSLDFSMRGMSALVCGAPQVGETVVIELPLHSDRFELLASVRHSNNARTGFEFFPLSPLAEQGMLEWIQELGRHDEMLFPYGYTVKNIDRRGVDPRTEQKAVSLPGDSGAVGQGVAAGCCNAISQAR